MKLKSIFLAVVTVLFLASCSSDDKKVDPINSRVSADGAYDMWTYVNLETGEVSQATVAGPWEYYVKSEGGEGFDLAETIEPTIKGKEPQKWHIAFHNYEARTNGGEVVMTNKENISEIANLPKYGYVKDIKVKASDRRMIVDRAKMMQGNIGYAGGNLNEELTKWVKKIPTGTMPPYKYELSKNVFVIKFFDGSVAKVKFTDHLNGDGKKAAEFEYEFTPAK